MVCLYTYEGMGHKGHWESLQFQLIFLCLVYGEKSSNHLREFYIPLNDNNFFSFHYENECNGNKLCNV
jgi:hypothetical protein